MSRNQTSEDDMIDEDINAKLLVAAEACSGGGCTLPAAMEMQIRVSNFYKKNSYLSIFSKIGPTNFHMLSSLQQCVPLMRF